MPDRFTGLLLLVIAAFALAPPTGFISASAAPQQLAWQTRSQPIATRAIAAAALPQMRISVGPVTEGGMLVFSIAMVPAIAKPVPVDYAFSGDVSALVDASSGSGRIPPGGALTVERRTRDDGLVNGDRRVVLSAATPGISQPQSDRFRASASGLVQDNDVALPPPPPAPVLPQVRLGQARPMTEGNTLRFPLRLSKPADRPVTVYFGLDDPDRVAAAGTVNSVTIAAGATTSEIPVNTIDDGALNGLRPVTVRLLRASGAVLTKPASARGFVADNDVIAPVDPEPTPVVIVTSETPTPKPPVASSYAISVSKHEVTEGEPLTFTVTRSGNLSAGDVISYALRSNGGGGFATSSQDSLEFMPNDRTRSFEFSPAGPILEDQRIEVSLVQNDGAPQVSIGTVEATILDNPDIPSKGGLGPTETHRAWYDVFDLGWPLSLIPILVLIGCVTGAVYLWRKREAEIDLPIDDPLIGPKAPPPPLPKCTIDCTPEWAVPQEPSAIGPLTLPELHFAIAASLREPTTPYALGATFLEERDEPDDQL